MKIEDGIQSARDKGFGIVITDHMDINPFRGPEFTFNVPNFFKAYEQLRSDDVLIGIELGFRVEAVTENTKIVDGHNFDFILGSTHAPYDMETPLEYYDKEYYENMTKVEAYNEYFSSMLKGIKENTYFDSLAHIDYIARYSPYADQHLYYDEHADSIDQVLRVLVELDKSMEISTRRIGDPTAVLQLNKIYKRFAELGGKTVTIGSDSHVADGIGNRFDLAFSIAKDAGLKPVYYKNRKRVYIDI